MDPAVVSSPRRFVRIFRDRSPALPAVQTEKAYLANARSQGLGRFARASWKLYSRAPFERAPAQPHHFIERAYEDALHHLPQFAAAVVACAKRRRVGHRVRTVVKDANRVMEKMTDPNKTGGVPLDLVAGTLICTSVRGMYATADRVFQDFRVVSFRDRMITPVASRYRDLQLIVDLGGHLAELKIVHHLFQEIDEYEHKVYEVQRSIDAKFPRGRLMPPAVELVTRNLTLASQRMYDEAWEQICAREGV